MTGDRRLKPHEMKLFLEQKHASLGLDTVKETLFTGGEPTLFEIVFLEIIAKLEAHQEIIINQGAQLGVLASLESTIRLALVRLEEFDKKLEEQKQFLMDQIVELERMWKEIEEHEKELGLEE